jgi:hypothetical protein
MAAPLNASGISAGISLAWRSDGPWYVSGRTGWTLASGTLDGASIHRLTAGALVGWRGWSAVAPFVELGPQWVPTFVVRAAGTQGDLTGFGGRLAIGAQGSQAFMRGLRLALTVDLDAVRRDGARSLSTLFGAELSVSF